MEGRSGCLPWLVPRRWRGGHRRRLGRCGFSSRAPRDQDDPGRLHHSAIPWGSVECSLAYPGGNFDLAFDGVASKWVEFMVELLLSARGFAVIAANDQSSRNQAKSLMATAARLRKDAFVRSPMISILSAISTRS
jgi:hypothetical protein